MITLGFTFSYSDVCTVGVNFPYPSSYLWVNGDSGDIVYEAPDGTAQWFSGVLAQTLVPISAIRVLVSGTVNGTLRTTTATDIFYCSAPIY